MIDIAAAIAEHQEAFAKISALEPAMAAVATEMTNTLKNGGKVLWMGNGGSAADSQHLAAELMGRFMRERPSLASVALTTDTSVLTAIGNDYGYELVFARQIAGLCRPGDFVVGISTSGNSENCILGLRKAREIGARTAVLVGKDGGKMKDEADHALIAPGPNTARIQECHIFIGHTICDWVEAACMPQG
ncbi:D-sedoheptulose 7-phosphate isomerase [Magnetofaba australis]|uniref:Phosphoheptose isomerase n=1 Tax=Magnetofaba australis IT-1 TaxID=1434232 RepID=A0A1Y2K5Z5_9PROT|nr:D-sedoheptulose 7-phosphate isomerase [Magnetofaba australis]OSM04940.1 putative phosphoheptose isomerase [Magnetofaba australis IT-1]